MNISRPEQAILAGVTLVIVSAVLPTIWAVRIQRREAAVRADLRALVEAARRFSEEYGMWPTARNCGDADCRFGREIPNREVMNVLRAIDGPGNGKNEVNPHRLVFIEIQPQREGGAGVDAHGDFLDPWSTPYQIVLDSNLNGFCHVENSIYGEGVGEGLIAWSCGPDRLSDTPDDITSWEPTK